LQDVLSLGSETRMNTPAQAEGSWTWRLFPDALGEASSRRLRELTEISGRLAR
jgi:4-alpha-glucanotransferase